MPDDTEVGLDKQAAIMRDALLDELEYLWGDFDLAIKQTIRTRRTPEGAWSIHAEGLADRIQVISHIVGAIDPYKVQSDLLLNGTYERLHKLWGIPTDQWDLDRVAKAYERYHSEQGATLRPVRD